MVNRKLISAVLPLVLLAALVLPTPAQDDYQPGPDSKSQPGVPKGEVLKFSFEKSKVFPGTFRDYWVYVPAQYRPDQPACVYVNQDGLQYEAPTVFDNLIHKKEMPITIGVFVMHGRVRAATADNALDRFNRSYEYDGLGDNYARFLLEELLPEVETKKTSDGRPIRLSQSGNDRAIGGQSSGAICAFTAAWERPDAFSRVFSASSVAIFSSCSAYFAGSVPLLRSFSASIRRSITSRSAYSARSFSLAGAAARRIEPIDNTAADWPSFAWRPGSRLPSLSPLSSSIACSVGNSPSRW
jgi:hypothetical protein